MSQTGGTIFYVVSILLAIFEWVIFVWVILSWVLFFGNRSAWRWRYRRFYIALERANAVLSRFLAPLLRPFRRLLPPWKTGGIDFSPLLLLLAVYLVRIVFRAVLT